MARLKYTLKTQLIESEHPEKYWNAEHAREVLSPFFFETVTIDTPFQYLVEPVSNQGFGVDFNDKGELFITYEEVLESPKLKIGDYFLDEVINKFITRFGDSLLEAYEYTNEEILVEIVEDDTPEPEIEGTEIPEEGKQA